MGMDKTDADHHNGFYLHAIQDIYHEFEHFVGRKTALIKARKAPLDVDKDGTIIRYYGKGEVALETLVDQYATYLGERPAYAKTRKVLAETVHPNEYEKLPDHLRPRQDQDADLLERLEQRLSSLFPHPG
jgi:hypothetical protein